MTVSERGTVVELSCRITTVQNHVPTEGFRLKPEDDPPGSSLQSSKMEPTGLATSTDLVS